MIRTLTSNDGKTPARKRAAVATGGKNKHYYTETGRFSARYDYLADNGEADQLLNQLSWLLPPDKLEGFE